VEAQVRAARLLLVVLLAASFAHARIGPAAGPKVFSNVRATRPAGEIFGDELILVIIGHNVSATLNHFQGGQVPVQRVLKGTLRGARLHLHGKHEFGKIHILGTLASPQLNVTITDRAVGQQPQTRQAQLLLVKKCWFPSCGGPAD